MPSPSIQEITESGDAYWRSRVVALEGLVAELLIKNQNMRLALGATREMSTTEVSGKSLISEQRSSVPQS